ncbi:sensor protein zRas [Peziza echinospora]|nr:sensor protein zRas [Peziza echinospora]
MHRQPPTSPPILAENPSRAASTTYTGSTQPHQNMLGGGPRTLEKMKEAADAHIRSSQAKIRARSKLDQAESVSTSPPAFENGLGKDQGGPSTTGDARETGSTLGPLDANTRPHISNSSSYPFPQMPTPRINGSALSPSVGGPQDRALPSGSATPSSFAFMPTGTDPNTPSGDPDFPTPKHYEMALSLHSEPGLDAFWRNLTKLCTTFYKADRLSLAVPKDSTDLENTSWGQKATYLPAEHDTLSMTYMGDGGVGDVEPEEDEEVESDEQAGVPIPEEYSGTAQTVDQLNVDLGEPFALIDDSLDTLTVESSPGQPFSPVVVGVDHMTDTSSNSDWLSDRGSPPESPRLGPVDCLPRHRNGTSVTAEESPTMRVLPTLQELNYEADALLDGPGVIRVLQRGKTVVLSREYRDIQSHLQRPSAEKVTKKDNRRIDHRDDQRLQPPWTTSSAFPETSSEAKGGRRRENMHISLKDMPPPPSPSHPPSEPPTPLPFVSKSVRRNQQRKRPKNEFSGNVKQFYSSQQHQLHHSRSRSPSYSLYEEYEQPPSSPWSQSPAPSPAIKQDPSENPFFVPPRVDEDSFNPVGSSPVYSAQEPVHAIGLESTSTVIHIPLVHPSSTDLYPVKLEANAPNDHVKGRPSMPNDSSSSVASKERRAPIAILSILSPVIPYPSKLIRSLSYFAPFIATAFALAQAHDNLQLQLTQAFQRHKRPFISSRLSPGGYGRRRRGSAGVTMPSDFSRSSNSANTSRVGSPFTDVFNPSLPLRRTPDTLVYSSGTPDSSGFDSPATYVDGYFTPQHTATHVSKATAMKPSRRDVPVDKLNSELELKTKRQEEEGDGVKSSTKIREANRGGEEGSRRKIKQDTRTAPLASTNPDTDSSDATVLANEEFQAGMVLPTESNNQTTADPFAQQGPRSPVKGKWRKRRGQSLVPTAVGASYTNPKGLEVAVSAPRMLSRKSQRSHEMAPLSNKLLRKIIDSIAVHVFVATPVTGATTWGNARIFQYTGLAARQFLDDPWSVYHPDQRAEYERLWKTSVETGIPLIHQIRMRRWDGTYRWFMIRVVPSRDGTGRIVNWIGTNVDIHDQKLAEINITRQQEMAESEKKYRSLANSSPQIVFAADADGITFSNTQWETYSGQTPEDSYRFGFMEFVHPQDRHKCSLPTVVPPIPSASVLSPDARRITEGGRNCDIKSPGGRNRERGKYNQKSFEVPVMDGSDGIFSTELRLRRVDNEYRWHLIRCVRVESTFGEGDGQWFGTCTDINDHKLLEQRLKEANEAAQRTMESKTRFLANMSHEIRTPLIGISGMVNFLLDTSLSGEQLDYCHTISQSSEGLLMVINDILDLSKVEAGMMRLNSTWFRIHSLIEDANELLGAMAIQKNLELNYIVDEDVPLVVGGDRVRLRQVLLNVIGNAIKFTNTGEVFSRCSLLKDAQVGEDEVMLQFECHDTGPGFDKNEEALIFKPFSQIDGSSTRAHGGSGLGLVISRQLVELHGGKMTASSVKGQGSKFIFTAVVKVPPPQEETGTTQTSEDIDHILDKGFSESPSITPPNMNYSDTGSNDSSPHESQSSFITYMNAPDTILSMHQDPTALRLLVPSDLPDKVKAQFSESREGSVPGSPRKKSSNDSIASSKLPPPVFSILIVSPHKLSQHAISHHIRMTLPKEVPHNLEVSSTYEDCLQRLNSKRHGPFTHIVVNLPDHTGIVNLLSYIHDNHPESKTSLLVLTNPMQRTAVLESASATCHDMGDKIQFIYKPIKPSRFGFIFDPQTERDASMDRNRDSAQQVVESQKRVFRMMEKDVGNKGHRVLLVEDNPVNQKVLLRFLARVGLEVETASDGEECVSKVFSNGSGYYAVILCDLHMPRKDGFQACAEIRQWEKARKHPPVPIIALSANVMSNVTERCANAGFTRFVAKPVEFAVLSAAIVDLLDSSKEHVLMNQQEPQEVFTLNNTPTSSQPPASFLTDSSMPSTSAITTVRPLLPNMKSE